MNTLTQETPQQAAPRRPRRRWLIVLIAVLVVAGLAVGTWAIIDANQSDDLAVASEFADTADIAFVTGEGDAWAALFTEDGVWKGLGGVTYEGRDAISRHDFGGYYLTEVQHGTVTEIGDGVFAYTFEYVWGGLTGEGEIHITVEGDLVSYAELVRFGASVGVGG